MSHPEPVLTARSSSPYPLPPSFGGEAFTPEGVATASMTGGEEVVSFTAMAFKGQNLNPKDPFEGNIGPVHPGAARYWKEQGIQVPEAVLK
jgi:hypothetical protein